LRDLVSSETIFQLVHPALPPGSPRLRSLQAFAHNLPVQLTSFIGREQVLAELRALLRGTRLLTLTGAGGCGKTRLALQLAAEELDTFRDGVWLVELAALREPAVVGQAAAAALGIQETPGRPVLESLCEQLRARNLLLV